jgi:hypothetical protein
MITIFTLVLLTALQMNVAMGQVVQGKAANDSHWTFDKANVNGKIVKDVWDGRDGEIFGNPQIVSGKIGDGIKLNGTDEYIKVSTLDISPSTYPAITLAAWVYPTSTGVGGQSNRRFMFAQDDGGFDRGLLMEGSQWRLGTGTEYWNTGVEVVVNSWQHVAIVYDSTDIKFYMNGVKYSYASPGKLGDGYKYLLIGTHPTQARFFAGIIDDVYVYGAAMSELEIKQIMVGITASSVDLNAKLSITWAKMKTVR